MEYKLFTKNFVAEKFAAALIEGLQESWQISLPEGFSFNPTLLSFLRSKLNDQKVDFQNYSRLIQTLKHTSNR